MTEEQFLYYQDKSRAFACNSFSHVKAFDYQEAEVLQDDSKLIGILVNGKDLAFSASNAQDLLEFIQKQDKPVRLEHIPRSWESILVQGGLIKDNSMFEFTNNALFVYKDAPLICLPAKREDANRLEAISLQTMAHEGRDQAWFSRWMESSEVLCFGYGKNLIGYVALSIEKRNGKTCLCIGQIAVLESEQGRGIGRSLMSSALRWGYNHSANRAYLLCDEKNEHAQRLFKGFGFHMKRDGIPVLNWLGK